MLRPPDKLEKKKLNRLKQKLLKKMKNFKLQRQRHNKKLNSLMRKPG